MPSGVEGPWRTRAGALSGLKVLDLTRILAGPYCTMILADLGADVIKVEDVWSGDDTRSWGPPFIGRDAAYYHAINRNKRSIALDLKDSSCLEQLRKLARSADVVVENFRPGTAARLGLDQATLRDENPALVYASISGFGQTGPMAAQAGYDATAQALSGVMSVTGHPDSPPARFGVSGADLGAGMWAVIGILAALSKRRETGTGDYVDVALLDGQVAWLTYHATGYLASGIVPGRYGTAHPSIVPYQALRTANGHLMVAAGNDKLWAKLAQTLGVPQLVEDPAFRTNADRVRNRDELVVLLEDVLQTNTSEHWGEELTAAGVPAAAILNVDQVLVHPQVHAREMLVRLPDGDGGEIGVVGSPIKLLDSPVAMEVRAPRLGEHTDEILAGLDMHDLDIAILRDRGVAR
ncbi:crotonobetainyl-CoA:carnitine CoA-transferase CaiB-like acyl-CoA transferase [Marmoricola sp. URHA0025 HA25]